MARVWPALLAKATIEAEAAWSALHQRRAIPDTEVFMKQNASQKQQNIYRRRILAGKIKRFWLTHTCNIPIHAKYSRISILTAFASFAKVNNT